MLASVVRQFVNIYLAPFIDGLNSEDLQLQLWKGEAVISNVKLKKDALNKLSLPVEIKAAYLGCLRISIPWRLHSQHIEVRLERLFILCGPKDESQWSESEDQRRKREIKREQLDRAEKLKSEKSSQKELDDTDDVEVSQGYIGSLLGRIVENLQVYVEDIHIRYEDDETIPNNCFVAGITLESLSLQTTDENWIPTFVSDVSHVVHKKLKLNNLAVYLNSEDKPIMNIKEYQIPSASQIAEILLQQIPKGDDFKNHTYILKPLSTELKLRMNKSIRPEMNNPKITALLDVESLNLVINDTQYGQLLALIDRLGTAELRRRFKSIRPRSPVRERPDLWWKFLRDALLGDVRQKKWRCSAEYISWRRRKRLEYMELWKAKLSNKLEMVQQAQLRLLEDDPDLTVEDILYFRALAEASMKTEGIKGNQSSQSKRGIVARTWGWLTGNNEEYNETSASKTETLANTLAQYLNYDEYIDSVVNAEWKSHLFGNYVQVLFRLRINMLTICIEKCQDEYSRLCSPMTVLNLGGIAVEVKQKPKHNSVAVDLCLHSIALEDKATPETAFPHIIKSFEGTEPSILLASSATSTRLSSYETWNPYRGHPFITAAFEINPVDNTGARLDEDISINLSMQPLQCVANIKFLMSIINLFSEKKTESILDLELRAVRQLETWKRDARLKLREQLSGKRTKLGLKLDVAGPKISIPSRVDISESAKLIIDFGYLHASSEMSPTSDTAIFYQDIKIDLTSFQVYICNSGTHTSDVWQLIDPLNISLLAQLYDPIRVHRLSAAEATLSGTVPLAEMSLNAEIPHVNILLSNEKILAVVNILTAIMSSISRPTSATVASPQQVEPLLALPAPENAQFQQASEPGHELPHSASADADVRKLHVILRMHHLDVLFEPNTAQPPCYIHLGLHQLVCDLGQAVTDMMQISVHLDELAAETASVSSIASCHTQLRVTDIGCRVIKHSQSLAVDGSITKITVEDKRDSVSYPLIIDTYTPDDLLKFEFKLFQSPIPSRRSQHLAASTVTRRLRVADTNQIAQTDMNLMLKVCALRAVIVKDWIDSVIFLGFVIQDTLESLMESLPRSPEPVEKSSTPTSTSTSTNSSLTFEISICQPQVIIPKQPTTPHKLIVNLGDINAFNKLDFDFDSDTTLEFFTVRVSSLNVQACAGDHLNILHKLVDDISAQVNIQRLVSKGDDKFMRTTPSLRVAAHVSAIRITLSDEVIKIIMDTVHELSTPLPERKPAAGPQASNNSSRENVPPTAPNDIKDVQISTSLVVLLRELSIDLVRASAIPLGKDYYSISAPQYVKIAAVRMDTLKIWLVGSTDGGMELQANLKSLALLDTRPQTSNVFKQILGPVSSSIPSHGSGIVSPALLASGASTPLSDDSELNGNDLSGSVPNLLAVHLRSSPAAGMVVSAELNRLRVIFVPEFVFALLEFVELVLKQIESNVEPDVTAKSKSPQTPQSSAHSSSLRIRISLVDIDICAVPFPTLRSAPAFVCKFGAAVDHDTIRRTTTAAILNLQLTRCQMNRQQATTVFIVDPLDASLTISDQEKENSQFIDILLDSLCIKASYHDVQLAMSLVTSIMESEYMTKRQSKGIEPDQSMRTTAPPRQHSTSTKLGIRCSSPAIQAIVISDIKGQNNAMISAALSQISVDVHMSDILDLEARSELEVNYYNPDVAIWEPLLESWSFSVIVHQHYGLSSVEGALDPNRLTTRVLLNSTKHLNLNITTPFIVALSHTLKSWQAEFLSQYKSFGTVPTRPRMYPYLLTNRLGIAVTYWTENESAAKEIEADTCIPLALSKEALRNWSRSRVSASEFLNTAKLSIRVPGFYAVRDVSIVKPGTRLIALRKIGTSNTAGYMAIDVNNLGGSIDIQLRSAVAIVNECSSRSVRVGSPMEPPISHKKLLPGETWYMPLLWVLNPHAASEEAELDYKRWSPFQVDMATVDLSNKMSLAPFAVDITRKKHVIWTSVRTAVSSPVPRRAIPALPPGTLLPFQLHSTPQQQMPLAFTSIYWHQMWSHVETDSFTVDMDSKAAEPTRAYITTIRLLPAIRIENRLCENFDFKLINLDTGELVVEQECQIGTSAEVLYEQYTSPLLLSVRVKGFGWSTYANITQPNPLEDHVCLRDDMNRELLLHLDYSDKETKTVTVYCKYWILNRSNLPLLYGPVLEHQTSDEELAAGQSHIMQLNADDYFKESRRNSFSPDPILSRPLLYCPKYLDSKEHYLRVRIGDSEWSKEIKMDTVGWFDTVSIPTRQTDNLIRAVQLGVHVELGAPSKYFRTRVIVFSPQYVLVNNTGDILCYKQKVIDVASQYQATKEVGQNQQVSLNWPEHVGKTNKNARHLSLRLKNTNTSTRWSSSFSVNQIGDFSLALRDASNDVLLFLRVEIKVEHATTFILISKISSDHPPYRIENRTKYEICVYQKDNAKSAQSLMPMAIKPFTWEDPAAPHTLVLKVPSLNIESSYSLDHFEPDSRDTSPEYPPIKVAGGILLTPKVVADGPTIVFKLLDSTTASPRSIPSTSEAVTPDTDDFDDAMDLLNDLDDDDVDVSLKQEPVTPTRRKRKLRKHVASVVDVVIAGIGVSVIDSRPRELLYLTLDGIMVNLENSNINLEFDAKIQRIQVDNQAFDGPVVPQQARKLARYTFPVVLSSPLTDKPFLHVSFVKSHVHTGIDYFRDFSVALQDLTVNLDRTFIEDIIELVGEITAATEETSGNLPTILQNRELNVPTSSSGSEKKLYFVALFLHHVQLHISVSSNLAAEQPRSDPKSQADRGFASRLLKALDVSLANLDGVPITLSDVKKNNTFFTRSTLVSFLSQRYKRQLLYQVLKLFGRVDLFGSPLTFLENLGTGVKSFFSEPINSLVSNPQDIVEGFAKGTTSLITYSTYGISNSASKATGALEKAIAQLSKHAELQQRDHALRYINSTRSLPNVLWLGMRQTGESVVSSLLNILRLPVEGWKRQGPAGAVYGLLNSVTDIPLRPTLAVVQTLHHAADTIRSVAALPSRLRTRPPRLFVLPPEFSGDESRRPPLTPYNAHYALGNYVLHHCISNGTDLIHEIKGEYEWHWTYRTHTVTRWWFVTTKSLIHCSSSPNTALVLKLKWIIPFTDIQDISMARKKIVIRLRKGRGDTTAEEKVQASCYNIPFADIEKCKSVFIDLREYLNIAEHRAL